MEKMMDKTCPICKTICSDVLESLESLDGLVYDQNIASFDCEQCKTPLIARAIVRGDFVTYSIEVDVEKILDQKESLETEIAELNRRIKVKDKALDDIIDTSAIGIQSIKNGEMPRIAMAEISYGAQRFCEHGVEIFPHAKRCMRCNPYTEEEIKQFNERPERKIIVLEAQLTNKNEEIERLKARLDWIKKTLQDYNIMLYSSDEGAPYLIELLTLAHNAVVKGYEGNSIGETIDQARGEDDG